MDFAPGLLEEEADLKCERCQLVFFFLSRLRRPSFFLSSLCDLSLFLLAQFPKKRLLIAFSPVFPFAVCRLFSSRREKRDHSSSRHRRQKKTKSPDKDFFFLFTLLSICSKSKDGRRGRLFEAAALARWAVPSQSAQVASGGLASQIRPRGQGICEILAAVGR